MPQFRMKSPPTAGGSYPPPRSSKFVIPPLSLPLLSPLLLKIGETFGQIAMTMNWLFCPGFPTGLLAKIQKAINSSPAATTVLYVKTNGLKLNYKTDCSVCSLGSNIKRGKALAELEKVTNQARRESEGARRENARWSGC